MQHERRAGRRGKGIGRVREVAHREQRFARAAALEGEHAGRIRIGGQPAEAVRRVVAVQGGVRAVGLAEHAEKQVERPVRIRPVQRRGLAPFGAQAELVAHEIELFARMGEHIQVKRARLRVFVPQVRAPHLLRDRRLAVHDLVVRQGEQVALVREVFHREQQLAAVQRALVRRGLEIFERVVHPAEVPFAVKAQSALVHRAGHAGVGGRVLRDQQGGGVAGLEPCVHPSEEFQRVAVDAARRVALPVDQAGDRVHAQAVKVELGQPVVGRGLQKAAHLAPRVDEVVAAPLALAHVDMRILIERRAVVARKAVAVHREVHGDEVHDRADARLMQAVDQRFELGGRAVARGRGEKACILVAP